MYHPTARNHSSPDGKPNTVLPWSVWDAARRGRGRCVPVARREAARPKRRAPPPSAPRVPSSRPPCSAERRSVLISPSEIYLLHAGRAAFFLVLYRTAGSSLCPTAVCNLMLPTFQLAAQLCRSLAVFLNLQSKRRKGSKMSSAHCLQDRNPSSFGQKTSKWNL